MRVLVPMSRLYMNYDHDKLFFLNYDGIFQAILVCLERGSSSTRLMQQLEFHNIWWIISSSNKIIVAPGNGLLPMQHQVII